MTGVLYKKPTPSGDEGKAPSWFGTQWHCINVASTIKTKSGGQRKDDLSDQTIEIGVVGVVSEKARRELKRKDNVTACHHGRTMYKRPRNK